MWNHAAAIIWAQWRIGRNFIPRSNKISLVFAGILNLAWYATFVFLSVVVAFVLARPDERGFVDRVLPTAFFICFLYWQVIPVLLASMGIALDLKKLLVYPIPHRELFTLEVLLRTSTGIEMLILLAGAAIGLVLNPKTPGWTLLSLLFFVAFNLLLSTGVRDLLVRLLARKRVREILTLLFVLVAALPQLLILSGFHNPFHGAFAAEASPYLPWTATARLSDDVADARTSSGAIGNGAWNRRAVGEARRRERCALRRQQAPQAGIPAGRCACGR